MQKIYKMRIRYYRSSKVSQKETSELLRNWVSASGLPYLRAEKVNAQWPRIAFGPQLALGQSSRAQYMDLYFDTPVSEQKALEGLSKNKNKDVSIISARVIPYKFPSVEALCSAAQYKITGLANYNKLDINEFLKSKEIMVSRCEENGFYVETNIKPFVLSADYKADILEIILRKVNGTPLRVELFLAKWLNLEIPDSCADLRLKDINIIKENLYYQDSLGVYRII